jgi:NADH-quinone oxidoreductase subunit B
MTMELPVVSAPRGGHVRDGGPGFGLSKLADWSREKSLWPATFGLACCAIEMMAASASNYDIARFGSEAMRFSPRQCDVMIVAGRVVMKMVPVLQRIWLQMPEPKWCISMGACACTGGVFDTYAVVQGVDRFIPVDMYVPGCPPRPDQLMEGIIRLHEAVKAGVPPAYELRSVAS